MASCSSARLGAEAMAQRQTGACTRTPRLSHAAAARRPRSLVLLPSPSPAALAAAPAARRRCPARLAATHGSNDNKSTTSSSQPPPQSDADFDLAVFRFTLGIPGFEDRMVPRVVGLVAAALVALNHVLTGGDPTPAQQRAELVDAVLAALCVVLPDVEEKLQDAAGASKGRRASSAAGGAGGVAAAPPAGFWLAEAPALAGGEAARRELAWASFALLRNTNSLAVMAFGAGGQAVMARGSLVAGGGGAAALLAASSRDASSSSSSSEVGALLSGSQGPDATLWLPDRASMARAGLDKWTTVPAAAQSALVVVRAGNGGGGVTEEPKSGGSSKKGAELPAAAPAAVVALSDRLDGLTLKDRKWVEAIADKLAGAGCCSAASAAKAAGKAP